MKRFILAVGGVCAAAAGLLVWGTKRTPNLGNLAHGIDDASADRNSTSV